jgi:hypothetical protein
MVFQIVTRFWVNEYDEIVAVQSQPRDDFSEALRSKRQLTAPAGMGAYLPLVHAAHG